MATTVAFEDLSTWLSEQPTNTKDTPYELNITGLTTSNIGNRTQEGTLVYIINQGGKYVDLSPTTLPAITSLDFKYFIKLVKTPIIPNSVTNLQSSFQNCTSLTTVTNFPDSVTSLTATFKGCTSLVSVPDIPNSVTIMGQSFYGCTSLVNAPAIPVNCTNVSEAFYNCTSLVNAPVIPASSSTISMSATFCGCTSLVNASVFPDTRTMNISNMYKNCTSLAYKPVIPVRAESTSTCYSGVTQTRWGGSTSQLESYVQNETNEFEIWEIDGATPTGKAVYGIDISNLYTWLRNKEGTTIEKPYEIKILSLTTSNVSTIKDALFNNPTKYVDLRYTIIPQSSDIDALFYTTQPGMQCLSLIAPPVLPTDAVSMISTFRYCHNLIIPPILPPNITRADACFMGTKIEYEVDLSTFTSLTNCANMFYNIPTLTKLKSMPPNVEDITNMFSSSEITDDKIDSNFIIPVTVRNMAGAFKNNPLLTTVSFMQNGVTNMDGTFERCTGLVSVNLIPSTVTSAKRTFYNCSSLCKINDFQVPLATLKNNTNFQNMFSGCTHLESIGYKINESDWHVWRLKYSVDENSNDVVSGKVFFRDGTSVNIPETQITKSDLQLAVRTDELWFPNALEESDTDVDDFIVDMLSTKYGVFKKATILPDAKTMVLWADNPQNVVSNFLGGSDVFNLLHPIGSPYTQYPETPSPNDMWGHISTWVEIDFGGAFFRTAGGNADAFENEKTVTAVSGTTLTIPNHGLPANSAAAGSVVYDYINNESRRVVSVSGDNVVVDSAFTDPTKITNVLISQLDQLQDHYHTYIDDAREWYPGHLYNGGSYGDNITRDSNKVSGARVGDETRPINFTYKIWKRIN